MTKLWLKRIRLKTNTGTYFFSNAGDDGNDGHSILTPLKTIAKYNTLSLSGGQEVLWRCGDTFNDAIMSPTSLGSAGHNIIYGNYGSGSNPIIDGSAFTKALDIPFSGSPACFLEFHNIFFSGGSALVCRIYTHDVLMEDCEVAGSSAGYGIASSDTTPDYIYNNTFRRLNVHDNHKSGIVIGTSGTPPGFPYNMLIEYSHIHHNGTSTSGDHGVYVDSGVTVRYNECDHNSSSGIKCNSEFGYSLSYLPLVYGNKIHENAVGVCMAHHYMKVYDNLIYSNSGYNVNFEAGVDYSELYFNTLVNVTSASSARGVYWNPTLNHHTIFENNLVIQDKAVVSRECMSIGGSGRLADVVANNTIDYNTYYYDGLAATKIFIDGSGGTNCTFAEWKALTGSPDAHGTLLTAVPDFATRYTDLQPKELGNLLGLGVAIGGYGTDYNGVARTDPPTPGCYDYAPPTPIAFVSGEVGAVGFAHVVVTFSDEVLASNYATGVTIEVNGGGINGPATISSAVRQAGNKVVWYILSVQVPMGATVTWEYNAAVGNYTNLSSTYALPTTSAQAITNTVDTTIGSRSFDGATDRIDWASVATLTGSPITISTWLYFVALDHDSYPIVINQSGDASKAIYLRITYDYQILYFCRDGDTGLNRRSVIHSIVTGAWMHILVTHDGTFTDYTTMHLYKDGTELTYLSGVNGVTEKVPSGSWSLGGAIYTDTLNHNGYIAQTRVFNRVLNSTEIAHEAAGNVDTTSGLIYYFKGNTASLIAALGGTGVADGTTEITGAGNGPTITYPD
jgi:hypothetical protein